MGSCRKFCKDEQLSQTFDFQKWYTTEGCENGVSRCFLGCENGKIGLFAVVKVRSVCYNTRKTKGVV